MVDIIFWIILGVFIGWNFPQPIWAKYIQDKVSNFWNKL